MSSIKVGNTIKLFITGSYSGNYTFSCWKINGSIKYFLGITDSTGSCTYDEAMNSQWHTNINNKTYDLGIPASDDIKNNSVLPIRDFWIGGTKYKSNTNNRFYADYSHPSGGIAADEASSTHKAIPMLIYNL